MPVITWIFIRKKHSQINYLAIIALIVLLFVVIYFYSSKEKIEKKTKIELEKGRFAREELKKIDKTIENIFETSIYEAVDEISSHGGYTIDNLPILSYSDIPYLFYKGNIVNVADISVIEQMLSQKIGFIIKQKILNTPSLKKDFLIIGIPDIDSNIFENEIIVSLNLPLEISYDEFRLRNNIKFKKTVNLRLGYLHKLAQQFLHIYKDRRGVESAMLEAIRQDPRISPNLIDLAGIDCDKKEIFKTKSELIYAFREIASFSAARELRNIRESELQRKNRDIEWLYQINENDINLSFIANPGKGEYESKEIIYYYPEKKSLPMSQKECIRTLNVIYTITLPVKIIIRDLLKTYSVKGVTGSIQTKPLEFQFYIMAYLKGTDIKSRENTDIPSRISNTCSGECNIKLIIRNSEEGNIFIDKCKFSYNGGRFSKKNIPCRLHTLRIIPSEPGLSEYTQLINIGKLFEKTIDLKKYGVLYGYVAKKNIIYCKNSGKLIYEKDIPLPYVHGTPPRGIEILLKKLDGFGLTMRTIADSNSYFKFTGIPPGKYAIIFLPLRDKEDIPSYKVEAHGKIIEIGEGSHNTGTIALDPLSVEKINDKYVRVTTVKNC